MTNENEYIHRFVDEAEVKRAETERIIQLKKWKLLKKSMMSLRGLRKRKRR